MNNTFRLRLDSSTNYVYDILLQRTITCKLPNFSNYKMYVKLPFRALSPYMQPSSNFSFSTKTKNIFIYISSRHSVWACNSSLDLITSHQTSILPNNQCMQLRLEEYRHKVYNIDNCNAIYQSPVAQRNNKNVIKYLLPF